MIKGIKKNIQRYCCTFLVGGQYISAWSQVSCKVYIYTGEPQIFSVPISEDHARINGAPILNQEWLPTLGIETRHEGHKDHYPSWFPLREANNNSVPCTCTRRVTVSEIIYTYIPSELKELPSSHSLWRSLIFIVTSIWPSWFALS